MPELEQVTDTPEVQAARLAHQRAWDAAAKAAQENPDPMSDIYNENANRLDEEQSEYDQAQQIIASQQVLNRYPSPNAFSGTGNSKSDIELDKDTILVQTAESRNTNQYQRGRSDDSAAAASENDDEEVTGPPRGFFYKFDYPVQVVVDNPDAVSRSAPKPVYRIPPVRFNPEPEQIVSRTAEPIPAPEFINRIPTIAAPEPVIRIATIAAPETQTRTVVAAPEPAARIPIPEIQPRNPIARIPSPEIQSRIPVPRIPGPEIQQRNPVARVPFPEIQSRNPIGQIANPEIQSRTPNAQNLNPEIQSRNPASSIQASTDEFKIVPIRILDSQKFKRSEKSSRRRQAMQNRFQRMNPITGRSSSNSIPAVADTPVQTVHLIESPTTKSSIAEPKPIVATSVADELSEVIQIKSIADQPEQELRRLVGDSADTVDAVHDAQIHPKQRVWV